MKKNKSILLFAVMMMLMLFALPCSAKAAVPAIKYRANMQKSGWQGWKSNGASAGLAGKKLRLEALQVKKPSGSGSIQYRVYAAGKGWQAWKANGATAGYVGQNRRIDAIEMKLTGSLASKYDLYYRVYAQKNGWMGWAKNGARAGTIGYARRLEAIQIKLVAKNGKAPGSTKNAYSNLTNANVKNQLLSKAKSLASKEKTKLKYQYVDVNGNGFLEMIAFCGVNTYLLSYNRPEGKTVVVKMIGGSGKGGGAFGYYNKSKHLFGAHSASTGGATWWIYKISGVKASLYIKMQSINAKHSATGKPQWLINGKNVSEKTFKAKYDSLYLTRLAAPFGTGSIKVTSPVKW
ncbi:MAG: hypothetical protein Q4B09_04445 [Lachnospiraceae bacterium]|nr:hypothetical protein [Lachnospiraceae bacterium]